MTVAMMMLTFLPYALRYGFFAVICAWASVGFAGDHAHHHSSPASTPTVAAHAQRPSMQAATPCHQTVAEQESSANVGLSCHKDHRCHCPAPAMTTTFYVSSITSPIVAPKSSAALPYHTPDLDRRLRPPIALA